MKILYHWNNVRIDNERNNCAKTDDKMDKRIAKLESKTFLVLLRETQFFGCQNYRSQLKIGTRRGAK